MNKKLTLLGLLLMVSSLGLFAQSTDENSDQESCYRKWYKIFQIRGADEVEDGDYDNVVVSLRQGVHGSCYYGKVTVKKGTIRSIEIRIVDGKFEKVTFDAKEDYAVINGISETIVAKLRGNRHELNVVFKEKLRPKGNSFEQAPDPEIEEYK
jgi:hypothetical protein